MRIEIEALSEGYLFELSNRKLAIERGSDLVHEVARAILQYRSVSIVTEKEVNDFLKNCQRGIEHDD